MSTSDPNSDAVDSSADKPAALAPDEPTAAHDVPADPTAVHLPVDADAEHDLPEFIPAVPGLGEPSAAEEVVPIAPSPPVVASPPVAPPPPAAPLPPLPPVAPVVEAGDGTPPVTSSGLPNPHGLPEIAVERPEVALGAAFAGGLVLAMILKRLAR